jgi:type IX secretion system PorP/SprF family membrane protein
MSEIKKYVLLLSLTLTFNVSFGQQTPLTPISYWVFTPFIYNPAITGSKDYLSIDFNSAFHGNSNTQLISANTRLSKLKPGYFSTPGVFEYKNVGIGGSLFHDINGLSRNIGASVAGSYHIPLTRNKLSFLSFGASLKGVSNVLDTALIEPANPSQKTFYPNLDVGLYYFDTRFFAGVSTVNLFGIPGHADTLRLLKIPAERQYFFSAGCKFLLNRSMNIVLEPSILISASDSTLNKLGRNIDPILKLYIENFCIGTYFFNKGKTAFFAQFRYPGFNVGAFFELPKKTAYFKGAPVVQFTLGLNIQKDKTRISDRSHW